MEFVTLVVTQVDECRVGRKILEWSTTTKRRNIKVNLSHINPSNGFVRYI